MKKKEIMVECPCCDGHGSWMDTTPRPNSRATCPPEIRCPFCGGKGTVRKRQADAYDPDVNYAEEARQEAAEARREAREDR